MNKKRKIDRMSKGEIVAALEGVMLWLAEKYRYSCCKAKDVEERYAWNLGGVCDVCHSLSLMMYNAFGVGDFISYGSDAAYDQNRLMSRKDVAKYLGVCPATVTLYEQRGLLCGVRNGARKDRVSGYTEESVRKVLRMRSGLSGEWVAENSEHGS